MGGRPVKQVTLDCKDNSTMRLTDHTLIISGVLKIHRGDVCSTCDFFRANKCNNLQSPCCGQLVNKDFYCKYWMN